MNIFLQKKIGLKRIVILSFLIMALFCVNLFIPKEEHPVSSDDQWYNHSAASFAGGDGSQGNPFLIRTAEQLARMNYIINILHVNSSSCYKLDADINLEGYHWQPIGMDIAFYGIFDGNGHSIRNMTIYQPSTYPPDGYSTSYAFISYCRNATIKNVTFVNAHIEGSERVTTAAVVTGDTGNFTKFENVLIIDSYVKSNAWCQGAIAGWGGEVKNCYVSGTTIVNNRTDAAGVGGLLGACGSSVQNSYYIGKIDSMSRAAGIVGDGNSTYINCGSFLSSDSINVVSGINYKSIIEVNNCASNVFINNSKANVINSYFGSGSDVSSSFYNDYWTSISYINEGFPILKQFAW